jgi:DNA-binding NarL/FixJ family response regulator
MNTTPSGTAGFWWGEQYPVSEYQRNGGWQALRTIVISMQNGLLSGAIVKYLRERGDLMPKRVLDHSKKGEPFDSCRNLNADILLMDVTQISPCTLEHRLQTARQIRKALPDCRIALLCDESADPDAAFRVKDAKKQGLIDGFFHSSVTGEYIADALDAL